MQITCRVVDEIRSTADKLLDEEISSYNSLEGKEESCKVVNSFF